MRSLAVRPLIDEAWGLVAIDEKSLGVEFKNQVRAEDTRDRQSGPPGSGVRQSAEECALDLAIESAPGKIPHGRIDARSRRTELQRPVLDRRGDGRG